MSETVSGTFAVTEADGKPIFKIDPSSGFVQITYAMASGQLLAELTNTGHLGLFSSVSGKQNISLDPFNVPGTSHISVSADPGITGIQAVAAAGTSGFIVGTDPIFSQPVGVFGRSDDGDRSVGVMGFTGQGGSNTENGPTGVLGTGLIGVRGETSNGVGVLGRTFGGGLAGRFMGDVAVDGADNSQIRLAAGGRLSISDIDAKQRIVADATGTLTVSDASGISSAVMTPGGVNLQNTSPGFSSNIVLETAGRVTMADAVGNTALYSAAGWTVNGSGGCAINGGNLTVTGNVTVQGDINLPGADCAERFDVVDARTLGAGTVVVIDQSGAVAESTEAYDRKVAGIVSGAGPYRPGIILDHRKAPDGRMPDLRVPIALIGKVCCKATAPVAVGDLLTTSSVPGHAMRADDPARAFGAILGKALEALPSGSGLITVLVTLQ